MHLVKNGSCCTLQKWEWKIRAFHMIGWIGYIEEIYFKFTFPHSGKLSTSCSAEPLQAENTSCSLHGKSCAFRIQEPWTSEGQEYVKKKKSYSLKGSWSQSDKAFIFIFLKKTKTGQLCNLLFNKQMQWCLGKLPLALVEMLHWSKRQPQTWVQQLP